MNRINTALVAAFWIALTGCAGVDVRVTELPPPPSTGKLRVFVQPVESGTRWKTPYAAYAKTTLERVSDVWRRTGIYEVVEDRDVEAAVGSGREQMSWQARDAELARRVAKAVHAEYAMIVERGQSGDLYYWTTTLVNAETGRRFKVLMRVPGGSQASYQAVVAASYQQIFRDASGDLLATAVRKGPAAAAGRTAAQAGAKNAPAPETSRELSLGAAQEAPAPGGRKQLAVYDLESGDQNKVVGLILSEALRQEILKLGLFGLVSREATARILDEMALQSSGVVDEKQAVKVGRGLAAQQVVLGQLGSVGKTSVLQAKRIDVETQEMLASGTLRCEAGREEDLLDGMARLARDLAGTK